MHVYFVRHGETPLNAQNVHQSPNTPLSPKGRDEAISVAEKLRKMNPDLLISSEYTRALETARIIGLHTGLTPQTNGLFYEIMRPSRLFGQSHFSVETLYYILASVFYRKDASWRYYDAENYADIERRAQRARAYLESLHEKHESVVVVSHTIFINIIVAYLCRNRMLDVRDLLLTVLHIRRMGNTDCIHLEYRTHAKPGVCTWSIHGEI